MSDGDALLAAIRAHPAELTPQLLYRDWAEEHPDEVRAMIASVMDQVPRLTAEGIGVSRGPRGETREARQARFDGERHELIDAASHDAFAASVAWLATKGRRKTVDPLRSSYEYKHDVERAWADTAWHIYVANGVFIAAVVWSGFAWECIKGGWEYLNGGASLDVAVGISRRPLKPGGTGA